MRKESRRGAAENSIMWWLQIFGIALLPIVLACALSAYVQVSVVEAVLKGGAEGSAVGRLTGNWTGWLVYAAMMGGAMYASRRTRGMVPGIVVGVIGVAIYSLVGIAVFRRAFEVMPLLALMNTTTPLYAVFVALRNSILPVALGSYAGEKMGEMSDQRQGYEHGQVMMGQGLREESLIGPPPVPGEGLEASEFGAPLPPWVEEAQAEAAAIAPVDPVQGSVPEWAAAPVAPAAVAMPAVAAAVPAMGFAESVEPPVPQMPRERITTSCPKCRAGNAPSNARCIVCGAALPALT